MKKCTDNIGNIRYSVHKSKALFVCFYIWYLEYVILSFMSILIFNAPFLHVTDEGE
jgi:hypothetical protein